MDIDVSCIIAEVDPAELSASIAELGKDAGRTTWNNALAAAVAHPLPEVANDRDGVRNFFSGFGAWEVEEIAAWSDVELTAMVLQYAAGDLRELQRAYPGDGAGDIDWQDAEGTGSLYVDDNKLYICLDD